MVNITLKALWCGLLALTLIGCQGGSSPTSPAITDDAAAKTARLPGTVSLGVPQAQGEASLIPAAMWDVTIDVATLTASVGKRPDERAAQAYAETYLMEVTRYLTPSVMEIECVMRTAPDRLKVDYTIAHPFEAATNPNAPATATNRADLGFTGIVMFPLDVVDKNPITYFAETDRPIIANTDAIPTADGYYVPAGLVYGLDMQANCFPFRRLVNDARRESRIGIPLVNLGVGNFDRDFGWQRSNWGPTQTGWTGYGALHQGQVARNSVELNLPATPTTSISLPVMLIAKYLDPVGPGAGPADRSANRLPTADADRSKFQYRMPQGAWDVERVEVQVDGEFAHFGSSVVNLLLRVTDCDVLASQTAHAELRADLAAGVVEAGEAGLPSFAVSIPTLATVTPAPTTETPGLNVRRHDDTEVGGDAGEDSGGAEDPIFFRLPLSDQSEPRRPYLKHHGLLRVRDAAAEADHDVPIDPWLGPVTGDAPRIETYKPFSVIVDGPVPELGLRPAVSPMQSGTAPMLSAAIVADTFQLLGSLMIDWNGDRDFDDDTESTIYQLDQSWQNHLAPFTLENPGLEEISYTIRVRWWIDGYSAPKDDSTDFLLGSNNAPTVPSAGSFVPDWTMIEAQVLASPATFIWSEEPPSWSDIESDPISFAVRRLDTGEVVTSDTLPMAMTALPIASPPDTLVPFELLLCDPAHPGAAGTPIWTQTLRVYGGTASGWSKKLQEGAAYSHVGGLCVDVQGNQYVFGRLAAAFDFGGGVLDSDGAYVASFTPTGLYRWARRFPSEPLISWGAVFFSGEVDAAGDLILGSTTLEPTDFGGGPTPRVSVGIVALDAASGTYEWHRVWSVPGLTNGPQLIMSTDGDLTLAGSLDKSGDYTFGGPLRTLVDGGSSPFVLGLTSTGEYLWDYTASGGGTTTWGLGEDSTGQLYLSGAHKGSVDFGGGIQGSANRVPWLLSLASDGSFRWSEVLANGGLGSGDLWGIAGSRIGVGCLVAGVFGDPIDLGAGSTLESGTGFWVRYGSDGEWLWERRDAGAVLDIGTLPNGDFVLAGHFIDEADFGWGPIQSYGDYDSYLLRITDTGLPRWSTVWQGEGNNSSTKLSVLDDWIGLLATHSEIVDLDPTAGQHFNDAGTPSQGDHFLLTVRAEDGLW